ncbi:MAG TPA: formylglycine-generating enzyme family protein [Candidatus Latescibacteria bacterium]|nr:formylglycine-generating enzyme family protein [Candidatus Handelsmanbacteria bacterium]HIL11331.1 formylglycine-generating enzyme family protein [Candidatus Latescibacterota bacterium]
MEDWTYGLAIALWAVLWVTIFVDYRKKLMLVMPSVERVASRRHDFSTKISEAENSAQEISVNIDNVRREIAELEDRRREFQDKLNEREMVFISAGSFRMGSNQDGRENETPQHPVQIKSFYLDRFEVTNLQYKDFIDATDRRMPVHWQSGNFPTEQADHPVVNVNWEDAKAYADWVNKRLPTEAEWEWAARGTEEREYAWGKQANQNSANFNNPEGGTSSVSKYIKGQSEFGIWDMCGNVGEWVNDWYEATYYARSSESDPQGPPDGRQKVYRGGGYQTNRIDIRALSRHNAVPTTYQDYIGFRCALNSEQVGTA